MKKTINATGLAVVEVRPISDSSVALILTDAKANTFATMINPEGLNKILVPLLGCASTWADKPDLAIESLSGPSQALPAKRISFQKGRDERECAVRIHLGQKMEITFVLPVNEAVGAAKGLLGSVTETIRPVTDLN